MKKCPKCNASIIDTAKFCMMCGINIKKYEEENIKAKFCSECGTEILVGDFCPECGFKVNGMGTGVYGRDVFNDNWLKDVEISVYTKADASKKFANCQVGDVITFGSYMQNGGKQPIEWIVLEKDYMKILVISKYILMAKPYNVQEAEITWDNCTLRKWLNDEFVKEAFNNAEQQRIEITAVHTPYNLKYNRGGGNDTYDKVFLLSTEEANKYFSSAEDRKCTPTVYAAANGAFIDRKTGCDLWWLRSPGGYRTYVSCVDFDGNVRDYGEFVFLSDGGVRPAMRIKLDI